MLTWTRCCSILKTRIMSSSGHSPGRADRGITCISHYSTTNGSDCLVVESSQKAVEGGIPDETLNLPIGILLPSLRRPSTGSPGGVPTRWSNRSSPASHRPRTLTMKLPQQARCAYCHFSYLPYTPARSIPSTHDAPSLDHALSLSPTESGDRSHNESPPSMTYDQLSEHAKNTQPHSIVARLSLLRRTT